MVTMIDDDRRHGSDILDVRSCRGTIKKVERGVRNQIFDLEGLRRDEQIAQEKHQ